MTFLQIPCSSLNASLWLEQTIDQFEREEDHKERLIIPQRLNQQHKMEEYSIESCSLDQKNVLSYILQYLKKWFELDQSPELLESFKPLRMIMWSYWQW